jgi:thiol-disulfide isomerase/thioredoxin
MRPFNIEYLLRRSALLLGTTFLVATWSTTDAAAQMRGEVGIALGESPELVEIQDLDGNPVSLADFAGEKPVLFEFWAYWCENCAELHPQMVDAYKKYGDRIEFVGVGVGVAQSPRRIKRHLADLTPKIEWAMLFDKGGHAVRSFLAPATSYIAIIDVDGRVVYTGIGPEQDIDAVIRGVLGETEIR